MDDIEALVALSGLHMIFHLGISGLILEGDSLNVMEAVKSRALSFSTLEPLIQEIHHLLTHFKDFELSHVGRLGNEAAHLLARYAHNVTDTTQWRHTCPAVILNRVFLDADK